MKRISLSKNKRKSEIMTLKTNELYQKMQRAQELAQRLKQEQRIRELAQKGHDTSRLMKNLDVDAMQVDDKVSPKISSSRHDSDEAGSKINTCISSTTSPKKDTGVQTEALRQKIFIHPIQKQSKTRWHVMNKEEESMKINSFSEERLQSLPVPTNSDG
ncbi:coiled-coil domain-containing protein 66-like [Dipodomys merriami]|uniref:coiled-coil domain-containing protein 66-like n=1 Tax=Dipodomys merriami TaxID=94247 RepID=UPI00384FAB22